MDALTNRIGVRHVVTSDVSHNGTFVVGYPEGYGVDDFARSPGDHWLYVAGKYWRLSQGELGVSLGGSSVTVTWKGNRVLKAGEVVVLGLEMNNERRNFFGVPNSVWGVSGLYPVRINYGTPVPADTDGVALAQTRASAGPLNLNGVTASAGVATLDAPRVVTVTSAGNLSGVTFTIKGTDVRGRNIVHQMAGPNNSTVATTKTFKTVTEVSVSASMGGANAEVGFGNTFGSPVFLPSGEFVWKGLSDGVNDALTVVAGVMGEQTYTSGDAFGRITFTANPNGTRVLEAIAFVPSIEGEAAEPRA